MLPPLTIVGAALSVVVGVSGLQKAHGDTTDWNFWGSIVSITTGALSFCYGMYCVFAVIRTIRRGRGFGSTPESQHQKLGAISEYLRIWFARENYDSQDPMANFASEALIQSDFLQHAEREGQRNEQRGQVAAAVELLEVDPDSVIWHEDAPFAEGGFSKVWRVTYRGEVVVAKVLVRAGAQSISKAEAWMNGVKKEAAILHRLSACDSIVKVLGLFEKVDGAVLLMEYASGGSLRDYLHGAASGTAGTDTGTGGTGAELFPPPFLLSEVRTILIDVARAMQFCYAQTPPVQHRDLKPLNILRSSSGRWLVADFGISKVESSVTSTYTHGAMASPAWASPEQLDAKHQGEPSDVWSFGVVMWEVLTRQQPWPGKSHLEILTAVMIRGQRLPVPDLLREAGKGEVHAAAQRELARIMGQCWLAEPGQRPSFTQILAGLEGQVVSDAAWQHATRTGSVIVEGQRMGEVRPMKSSHCSGSMGVYELLARRMIKNHRGVWALKTADRYCYFASDGRWWISNTEDMLIGSASGFICSAAA